MHFYQSASIIEGLLFVKTILFNKGHNFYSKRRLSDKESFKELNHEGSNLNLELAISVRFFVSSNIFRFENVLDRKFRYFLRKNLALIHFFK